MTEDSLHHSKVVSFCFNKRRLKFFCLFCALSIAVFFIYIHITGRSHDFYEKFSKQKISFWKDPENEISIFPPKTLPLQKLPLETPPPPQQPLPPQKPLPPQNPPPPPQKPPSQKPPPQKPLPPQNPPPPPQKPPIQKPLPPQNPPPPQKPPSQKPPPQKPLPPQNPPPPQKPPSQKPPPQKPLPPQNPPPPPQKPPSQKPPPQKPLPPQNPPPPPQKPPSQKPPQKPLPPQNPPPPSPSHEKFLIYKCKGGIGAVHCSGWGNRVVGMVATYLLANATDRVFGIIMSNPCNLTDYLVPNAYNWIIPAERLTGLSSTFMDVRNSRKFTNSLRTMNFNDKYKQDVVYIANNQDYHDSLLRNKLYTDRLKWLSHLNKANIFKKVLRMLFKPHQSVQSLLDAFLGKAKKDPKKKLVCAQIRMGKNPTIPWDNRPMNTIKGVQTIWQFLHKYSATSWIFVTTDSQKVRKLAKSEFKNNSLDTEGEIIHLDKPYRGNICRGMRKLMLDQWILINCEILVISTSTFGRIPSYIRGTRNGLYLFSHGAVVPWNPF